METLFPIGPAVPEGFRYYPQFLSEKEEHQLLEEIQKTELHTFIFQGFEAKRKVASFGLDYNFEKRNISNGKPIPAGFEPLVEKISHYTSIDPTEFAELLLTEYPPLSVINWHRDAPPFGLVAGISLLSNCMFRFRPHEKAKQSRNSIISVPVERRSLYIIDSIARSDWQHSIAPVKSKRYSITLRTLKKTS